MNQKMAFNANRNYAPEKYIGGLWLAYQLKTLKTSSPWTLHGRKLKPVQVRQWGVGAEPQDFIFVGHLCGKGVSNSRKSQKNFKNIIDSRLKNFLLSDPLISKSTSFISVRTNIHPIVVFQTRFQLLSFFYPCPILFFIPKINFWEKCIKPSRVSKWNKLIKQLD
jgi:hypothetical protein